MSMPFFHVFSLDVLDSRSESEKALNHGVFNFQVCVVGRKDEDVRPMCRVVLLVLCPFPSTFVPFFPAEPNEMVPVTE